MPEKCLHMNFEANVEVNRILKDETSGEVERYSADVRIDCADCHLPFRFIGLPVGVDLNGAAVSVSGQEARLTIAPKGEVLTPLDSTGTHGFTVRRTK